VTAASLDHLCGLERHVLNDRQVRRVVPCVPGAEITMLEGENLTGKVKMALGPIKASFSGQATVGMDEEKREGG
jgi:carbon monoxide dehydrogenase subunit G